MPDMGGRELTARLQAMRPGTRVLFVSGYSDDELPGQRDPQEYGLLLAEPFTPDSLAEKVRQALDTP